MIHNKFDYSFLQLNGPQQLTNYFIFTFTQFNSLLHDRQFFFAIEISWPDEKKRFIAAAYNKMVRSN